MKHVTFANKSLLTGDAIADALIEYAAVLANEQEAKSVELVAYSDTGERVTATLLLGAGAPIMAESSNTDLPEPDNAMTLGMILGEIEVRRNPPNARVLDAGVMDDDDSFTP